ncbi:hypothetical protein TrRE_jg2886 [Triparma retinervis]|uniref:endo-1,4-beta-xylanase n=1 Tax=Triparma retinervis TaxID=2557542 RepID=A0A9W7A082_9STRA|nr:hypothetical protein TrRE_jg2886 [Triparma retinervis]
MSLADSARKGGWEVGTCVLPKFMFPEVYSSSGRRESIEKNPSHEACPLSVNSYLSALSTTFTSFTIEHHMKWGPLLNKSREYDFTTVDRMVDWGVENGFTVKGHVLIWHVTSPKFINDLPPAEFSKVVRNHIFTVMRHFRGRVRQWDVVNEALAPDGSMADTIFLRKMGPGYIAQCFRWAHEADPDAFLIYNDNKVEGWGLGSPHSDKAEGFFNLLRDLIEEGAPVHGAGLQGHLVASGTGVRKPPTPKAVANQIRRLSTLNLKVNLSEFDVRTSSLPDHLDPYEVQKEIVRDILSACFSQPNFTGVYFWGVSDAVSWVEDFYGNVDKPLILDSSYSPKPSHQGVLDAMSSPTAPPLPPALHDKSSLLPPPSGWGSSWMQASPPPSPSPSTSETATTSEAYGNSLPDWELEAKTDSG